MSKKASPGFTLIELIVAMTVMSILSMVLITMIRTTSLFQF